MIRRACLALAALLVSLAAGFAAQAQEGLVIGYIELADDARYQERSAYARIRLRAASRPFPAAEVAIAETATIARVIGAEFALRRHRASGVPDVLATIDGWETEGVRFVLLDLPADAVATAARETRGRELLLLNVTAGDDRLRAADCQPHLLHTFPSLSMQADALVQFVAAKDWRRLLVLQGPLPADAALAAAVQRAARRFGARIAAVKPFTLGNDPRQRDESNVALLTAGETYDLVVVADSDGEFGRYVPYQTKLPRPVVGTTGLTPVAWSWVWERHGAPQVNSRFEQHAGRRMADVDWAAWVAVKAIVQAVLRTKSTSFAPVAEYLRGERLNLDGAKGPPLSFRAWDNQLRQPIFLATHDAVVARAPIRGFLHDRNDLDTLGYDAPETECSLTGGSVR